MYIIGGSIIKGGGPKIFFPGPMGVSHGKWLYREKKIWMVL